MGRKSILLKLDTDLVSKLEKRARKNFLTVDEMVEDIVRRSMLSYTGGRKRGFKIDDKLVSVFSRERRGRKRKGKGKKK